MAKLNVALTGRGRVIPLRKAVGADATGLAADDVPAPPKATGLATPFATPAREPPGFTAFHQFRRRDSNPSSAEFVDDGRERLVTNCAVETAASETPYDLTTSVETGLSRLGCSNVANLLEWALEALDQGNADRVRAAVTMALDMVGPVLPMVR